MPSTSVVPFPVIIGAPRSGTTLLRMMLDSHSELAVPPETGFVPACAGLTGHGAQLRDDFLRLITNFPFDAPLWSDYKMTVDDLRTEVDDLGEFEVSKGLRAFYRLYAARFGKSRSGDKTPSYVFQMETIEQLLPEAHFIHLIRDGRDVALSWRQTRFSPGKDMPTLASAWRKWVTAAREGSERVAHYTEVRYERLVADPEPVLREICAFIQLPYEPQMQDYHRRSPERLAEHGPGINREGKLVVSQEQRHGQQKSTRLPLDPTKAGAWKSELTADDIHRFDTHAGALLSELGYDS